MRRFTKVIAPIAAMAAIGTSVLAGCGSSATNADTGVTLNILYRNKSANSTKIFQVLQQEFQAIGVKVNGVGVSNSDFLKKYLTVPDTQAKQGTWDLAIAGWGADWYGDAAAAFFLPLLNGEAAYPPVGSNFGEYNSAAANDLMKKANTASDSDTAAGFWAQADKQVMKDAVLFPVGTPKVANYHSKNISNFVSMPLYQEGDPTNVTKTGDQADTLYMLGVGDVDFMDPNITYYSSGQLAQRIIGRALFSYPAVAGQVETATPDLAQELPTKANGDVSADGKTVTIHLRDGAMWNSSPARPVVASDYVYGLKRSCNPVHAFGGIPDFADLLQGYNDWCKAVKAAAGDKPTPDSLKTAMATDLPAISAPDDKTVVYHLTQPVPYFASILTLPAFVPAPQEYAKYLPASADLAQHLLSDGPYQIQTYTPTKELVVTKNTAWSQAADPIRKQNFNKIVVNETGDQASIQQQLQTGSPTADLEWDTFTPATAVPALKNANDPLLTLTSGSAMNPYIVFNTVSPNNKGVLAKAKIRQALFEAISRDALIKVIGADILNTPLTHILPAEIKGSQNFSMWGYDPKKAHDDLWSALGK